MLMSEVKRTVRKFKLLYAVLLPLYKTITIPRYIVLYFRKKHHANILINQLKEFQPGTVNTVWFLCRADHNNLGDLAQSYCIHEWISNNYPNHNIFEITATDFNLACDIIVKLLSLKIRDNDRIMFQSGYTMNDNNPYENVRRVIIENFPKIKTLIFPQTIKYTKEIDRAHAINTYSNLQNVLLLARDKLSYVTATELFPGLKVKLFPDIVTSKIGQFNNNNNRHGILLCTRHDSEQYYEVKKINALRNLLNSCTLTNITDTNISLKNVDDYNAIFCEIQRTIDLYSHYQLVITDRYHGTIFALISNTPVIILKTTDHKVITGADWFKGVYDDFIYVADSLEDAENRAKKILASPPTRHIEEYFSTHYYMKLKEIFEAQ